MIIKGYFNSLVVHWKHFPFQMMLIILAFWPWLVIFQTRYLVARNTNGVYTEETFVGNVWNSRPPPKRTAVGIDRLWP